MRLTEYTPSFKSVKADGEYLVRSNMVVLKNQGNCTVKIDRVCELPPNGVLEYNMGYENTLCVWDMHVSFMEDFYAMYNGDNEVRKNLIIGESRIVGKNYSNYASEAS